MSVAPLPYFHDGAPVGIMGRRTYAFDQNTVGKGLSLWNSGTSSNDPPPAGWETPGFDDSAWGPLYDINTGVTGSSAPAEVWTSYPAPLVNIEQILVRQHISLVGGTPVAASVSFFANDTVRGIWLDGVFVSGTDQGAGSHPAEFWPAPSSALHAGDNVLAVSYQNQFGSGAHDAGGSASVRVTLDVPGASPLSYADAVLADSPLAYWPLDEASGSTFADATGNGHTGTLVGTGLTYGVPGPQVGSRALSFAGSDFGTTPYISVTAAGSLPPALNGTWTLEAWLQFDSTSGTTSPSVMGYGDPTPSPHYRNYLNLNGTSQVLSTAGATGSFALTYPLTHCWHYVAVTFDGTTRTVYVDGAAFVVVDTPPVAAITATDVLLGSTYPGGSGHSAWRGQLASLAIYGTCLTATQILAHYNAG